jgi:glycosyltransferase involved in cell wall biosynthesis
MQSDIFVLASYAEPFGLGILEAREARCAVIGTHVGGIVEQLGEGQFGRLVAPGDRQALADELIMLMTDRERLSEARKAAAQDLDRFRVERMASEYLEVYLAAIRSKSPATPQPHSGRAAAP